MFVHGACFAARFRINTKIEINKTKMFSVFISLQNKMDNTNEQLRNLEGLSIESGKFYWIRSALNICPMLCNQENHLINQFAQAMFNHLFNYLFVFSENEQHTNILKGLQIKEIVLYHDFIKQNYGIAEYINVSNIWKNVNFADDISVRFKVVTKMVPYLKKYLLYLNTRMT